MNMQKLFHRGKCQDYALYPRHSVWDFIKMSIHKVVAVVLVSWNYKRLNQWSAVMIF